MNRLKQLFCFGHRWIYRHPGITERVDGYYTIHMVKCSKCGKVRNIYIFKEEE